MFYKRSLRHSGIIVEDETGTLVYQEIKKIGTGHHAATLSWRLPNAVGMFICILG